MVESEKQYVKDLEQRLDDSQTEKPEACPPANLKAAAKLLLTTFERRETTKKAAAFRVWSCETSAAHAVSQQSIAAAALAEQLDATREKLVVLKRHMKKKGRNPPSLGSISESEGEDTTEREISV